MMLKIKQIKIDPFLQELLANFVQYSVIKVNVTLYA